MNYYCFVAGSKDLILDTPKGTPKMLELLEEYTSILSHKDIKLLRLLRLRYDNENILLRIKDSEAATNPLGNISQDTWDLALPLMLDTDADTIYKEFGIERYLTKFYQTIHNEEEVLKISFKENYLSSLYYNYAMSSKNKFIASWFEYNLNLTNIITALICKENDFDINKSIVSGNEISDTILGNYGAKDLGLNGIYEDFDIISAIFESSKLIEQERKYDALKWNWLEEKTFFTPFSIEKLLSYWLKCELLHRWNMLDAEIGKEMFHKILSELKNNIKF